jgi:hypothetical protein
MNYDDEKKKFFISDRSWEMLKIIDFNSVKNDLSDNMVILISWPEKGIEETLTKGHVNLLCALQSELNEFLE